MNKLLKILAILLIPLGFVHIAHAVQITVPSAPTSNYGLVSLTSGNYTFKAIPSCSTASSALTFNTGTSAFGCNVITGGSGGGSGTWSTTTSSVLGILINYPNNTTDVVVIGSTATGTARFYLDPNTATAVFNGLLTLPRISATSTVASLFLYASTTAFTASGQANIGTLILSNALTVANGGTGAATLTGCLTGNGTSPVTGSGTCNTSNATVSSVATNNGLTGGTITTTGTLGLDTSQIFNGALLQYNGSRLAATGTPALTVGYLIATTTSTSTLPNLEGTDICITGTTRCLKGALLSITGVDPITIGGLSLNQISCARCYPFTGSTNFAVTVQATTGIPWFQNGIHASTTSQFQWASTTSLSSENGINIGTLGNGSRSTFTTSNSGSETSALLLNNAGSAAGSAVGFSFQVNAATRGIIAGDLLNSVYASSRNSAGTTVRGWTLDTRQNFGIGTSTPNWSLQVASNTPYIVLTDTNASVGQWHVLLSNSDGVFNIGTSSDLLTATSSSFSIDGNQTFGTAIGTTTKFDARDLVTIGTTTSGLSATTTITNEAKCINQKAQDGSWFSYYWVNRAGVYSQIIEANLCR